MRSQSRRRVGTSATLHGRQLTPGGRWRRGSGRRARTSPAASGFPTQFSPSRSGRRRRDAHQDGKGPARRITRVERRRPASSSSPPFLSGARPPFRADADPSWRRGASLYLVFLASFSAALMAASEVGAAAAAAPPVERAGWGRAVSPRTPRDSESDPEGEERGEGAEGRTEHGRRGEPGPLEVALGRLAPEPDLGRLRVVQALDGHERLDEAAGRRKRGGRARVSMRS